MMFFGRRRRLLENALEAVATAQRTVDRSIEWMKIDAAIVRHALNRGGAAELSVPDDAVRMLLSEQFASLLIATRNLMEALGRKHLFNLRDLSPPLDPKDAEELVAKVWAKLWPERRYPRLDQLTPEQRYYVFGPGGPDKSE